MQEEREEWEDGMKREGSNEERLHSGDELYIFTCWPTFINVEKEKWGKESACRLQLASLTAEDDHILITHNHF